MEQIPNDQMMQWLKNCVDRMILNCAPTRVLDVGCGTGLLFFEWIVRLAEEHGEHNFHQRFAYTGIELSVECTAMLQQRIEKYVPAVLPVTRVFAGAGHEVQFDNRDWWFTPTQPHTSTATSTALLPEGCVDTIIINSVVMYLPTIDYLYSNFTAFVKHVQLGGSIYCGDVRDSRSLRMFYYAIAVARDGFDAIDVESQSVRNRVDEAIANDPHLLVSPLDYIRFAANHNRSAEGQSRRISLLLEPKLSNVSYAASFAPRGDQTAEDVEFDVSKLDNEMTRFRFDATLYVDSVEPHSSHYKPPLPSSSLPLLRTCRVLLSVDYETGELLSCPPHRPVVAFNVEPFLLPTPSHSTPREQLSDLLERLVALMSSPIDEDASEYALFTYPHLPVLVDGLYLQPLFDKEGKCLEAERRKAIRAAQALDTPLQLLQWFSDSKFASQWQLKVTLHPRDPQLLLCIIAPHSALLRIEYSTIEGAHDPNLIRLLSTQPKSSARHAHFFNIPDVIDGWIAASMQRLNATTVEFPAAPIAMGDALWRSLEIACRSMPEKRAIFQPNSQKDINWATLALWSDAVAEVLRETVSPGTVVIQFVDRSIDQLVGMLAVFGVGGVFAPLAAAPNPDPPARIAKVFSDCRPAVLLTQAHLVDHLEEALNHCPAEVRGKIRIICAADHRPKSSKAVHDTLDAVLQQRRNFWKKGGGGANVTVHDPSYCIYTSGSTSLPKAVVLTHSNFHHLVCAFHFGSPGTLPFESSNENGAEGRIPSLTIPSMRTLQTTAASFDLHIYECLAPLYYPYLAQAEGKREVETQLILLPPGALDIEAYASTIDQGEATHVVCTPTMLGSLAEYCTLANCWAKLRHVRVWRTGGEALKQSTVDDALEKLRIHNPSVEMWCSYGPAECTDSATISRSETTKSRGYNPPSWTPYVTIGRPLANYGIYVVVEAGENDNPAHFPRLARAGESGMIYLAGPAVYKGYLQRDDLTSTVRKQMEFGGDVLTIYRTGDKGKYSFDATGTTEAPRTDITLLGQFWHLGRTDFAQVKIRGQRIETTEIESIFMQHGDVGHTIVAKHVASSHQHDEEFLVAYYSIRAESLAATTAEKVARELRALAVRSFPVFMVPSSFTYVAEFQTNRNGKVDRKLLPTPQRHSDQEALNASSTTLNSSFPSETSSPMMEACTDERLLWLRQQFLFHWIAAVPCPTSEIYLTMTPTCCEAPFTHSWVELGASSITLMRFIARLKVFLQQWVAPTADSVPEHTSAVVRVSTKRLVPPEMTPQLKQELNALLTFPQVYKHRHINGITKAIVATLFPEPKVPAKLGKNGQVQQPLQHTALDDHNASDNTAKVVPVILYPCTTPPEPTPTEFKRRWVLIIASVWVKRNLLFVISWLWGLVRLFIFRQSVTLRKLYDPLRLPGSTQQSIFYLDEKKRVEEYAALSQDEEDKQFRFFNCPYVLRIKHSPGVDGVAPAMTLRQAQQMVHHLEGITQHILQVNPSARVTLQWDDDRIVQYVFDLNDPHHEDVHRFKREYIYADGENAPANYFAFSCTDVDTALTKAVQRAAREKISITDKKALFRFKAFFELSAESQGTSIEDVALLDSPILSLHVMFNFHHAAFDGHSMQQILREIVTRAVASPSGTVSSTLPRAPLRKLDPFFRYCAEVASGRHLLAHQSDIYYWLRDMEGWRPTTVTKFMPRTLTHEDGKWPTHRRFFSTVGKLRTFLSADEGSTVRNVCGRRHWTPYSLFMACYYLVLAIVQNEKLENQGNAVDSNAPFDLCIGSAFSTRMHAPDLHNRVCCFSDIYPFRLSNILLKKTSFGDLVNTVQEMLMTHMEHSTVDVGTILVMMGIQQTQEAVRLVRTPLVNPLFAPVMLYEDVDYCQVQQHVPLGGGETPVDLELLDLPDFGALAEIQLKVNELLPRSTADQSAFALTWEYASELYDAPVMRRIAHHYNVILERVLSVGEGHPLNDTLEQLCARCSTTQQ
ncbi:syringomycin synthetase, putative [Bodo saltans]|uniref:Syringomycin synthetase, putative n=1 Tax=Bodo saltans TaxID=75058 RepID=A0A0S4JJF8_BODSA|nr:syringomycin synthetase, putative [Bodo saltans]|eukprot:CUG89531.1 syringomycin synthetase, putative [Bodo saltans]